MSQLPLDRSKCACCRTAVLTGKYDLCSNCNRQWRSQPTNANGERLCASCKAVWSTRDICQNCYSAWRHATGAPVKAQDWSGGPAPAPAPSSFGGGAPAQGGFSQGPTSFGGAPAGPSTFGQVQTAPVPAAAAAGNAGPNLVDEEAMRRFLTLEKEFEGMADNNAEFVGKGLEVIALGVEIANKLPRDVKDFQGQTEEWYRDYVSPKVKRITSYVDGVMTQVQQLSPQLASADHSVVAQAKAQAQQGFAYCKDILQRLVNTGFPNIAGVNEMIAYIDTCLGQIQNL